MTARTIHVNASFFQLARLRSILAQWFTQQRVGPWLLDKGIIATSIAVATFATATATAALFASAEPKSAPQIREIKLPAEIEQALRENGRQLSPITVTCQSHLVSKIPEDEAIQRLNMADAPSPKRMFRERNCRTTLQDHKLHVANMVTTEDKQKNRFQAVSETVFDGRFSFLGSHSTLPQDTPYVMKQTAKRLLSQMADPFAAISPFFQIPASFTLSVEGQQDQSDGQQTYRVDAESAVLAALRGGKLISVDDVTLDGRRVVRVILDVPNPVRTAAEKINIDQLRERQKHSVASPQLQEQVLQNVLAQRQLPPTCRYTYYVDPALHYAVRQFERSYLPNTLLSRTVSSDFQQVPGRPLWLPRRMETEVHETPDLPGTALADSFLTDVMEVSAYDFGRVLDNTFTLDQSKPGTSILDFSDPAAKGPNGSIHYEVPARPEQLASVIDRARKSPTPFSFGGPPLAMSRPLDSGYRNSALYKIVVANVVVIACIVGIVVWRRRKELE